MLWDLPNLYLFFIHECRYSYVLIRKSIISISTKIGNRYGLHIRETDTCANQIWSKDIDGKPITDLHKNTLLGMLDKGYISIVGFVVETC